METIQAAWKQEHATDTVVQVSMNVVLGSVVICEYPLVHHQ